MNAYKIITIMLRNSGSSVIGTAIIICIIHLLTYILLNCWFFLISNTGSI